MHVVHVIFDLDGGGMESVVASLSSEAARSTDVTMSVISLSGRPGRIGISIAGELRQYEWKKPLPTLSMVVPLGIARSLRRMRADVVHLHSGTWYKGCRAARLAGIKRVVYTEHGREHLDPPLWRWLDRRASRYTHRVVAVSDRLRTYLRDVVGVDDRRLTVIENAVDTRRFKPGPVDRRILDALQLPTDAIVVGSMGRLERVKAYDVLLDAFVELRADVPPSTPLALVVCGDGSERADLETRAKTLGIDAFVRFPGWVADSAEWYRLFDVFALTSTSEGSSISLLEAMASGAVPVVTDVGANRAVLGGQLGSQLVATDDTRAVASALLDLVMDRAKRVQLQKAARERVVDRFSVERMFQQYVGVYGGS